MKNHTKIIAALAIALIMMMLPGCTQKPKPEDAENYTAAVFDSICKQETDSAIELKQFEEGTTEELRDALMSYYLDKFTSSKNLSDETISGFKNVMSEAMPNVKYTVGDAVETSDGGFDVTVTIEPYKLFDGVSDHYEGELIDQYKAGSFTSMSGGEMLEFAMKSITKAMEANVENPKYGEAVDMTVHYGLIDEENGIYGIQKTDIENVLHTLFKADDIKKLPAMGGLFVVRK